ncbi:MAG: inositol-3-phosphate synthase [Bacteroidaceae bacterium]|nr:inositol-3-phosphate synthase [Bacteroidaceae bacterium]
MKPAEGKLGVLCVGLGAVSTTFIAGVLSLRKGLGLAGGSITQLAKIRVGRGEARKYLKVTDLVPLCSLQDIVFGAWDIFSQNAYEAALNAKVLRQEDLLQVRQELESIRPMPAAFDDDYVSRLSGQGTQIKQGDRASLIAQLRRDIQQFKQEHQLDRVVVIWAASTEKFIDYQSAIHGTLSAFEQAIAQNQTDLISPSMCYAYAALSEGVPFVMGAPNLCLDIPAMWQLAETKQVPIAGKDFKTGQTLMKTVLAPMLRTRCLGLEGWFSTNILGNRDGEVLDAPENFRTKEVSKLGVIDTILRADQQPELYDDVFHKVRINYYPPRGDNKESWDNLDIFGWMGREYGMQIKVNFLCRDSILAAPVVLDLVLCIDLAARAGLSGNQDWLSFFLKSPMHDPSRGEQPVNDLFQQYTILKNKLRELGGYEPDEELE